MIKLRDSIIQNDLEEIRTFIQEAKQDKGREWCQNLIIGDACREAILLGHERVVQLFLDEGLSADAYAHKDGASVCPLKYFAAKIGNLSIVKLLVNNRAIIQDKGKFSDKKDNAEAMRAAIEGGHANVVQYLLENGGSANGIFLEHHSPTFLGRAAYNGQKLIVDLLVQYGARVKNALGLQYDKFRDHYINRAIHSCPDHDYWATKKQALIQERDILLQKYSNSVKMMLDYAMGIDFDELLGGIGFLKYVDITGFNFVGVSVNGQPVTQEYLLARGFKGAAKAIVTCNDIDNIEDEERRKVLKAKLEAMLKKEGKMISQDGVVNLVPLADAAKRGLFDVVQVRLSAGINPNQKTTETFDSKFAIVAAAKNGFLNVVKLLAEHPSIDKKILVTAAQAANGHLEIVNCLSLFMDVNDIDSDGEALIHKATRKKDLQEIKQLLSRGADINLEDENGNTPLSIAASKARKRDDQISEKGMALLEFLVSNGADINNYKNLCAIAAINSFKAIQLFLPKIEKKDLKVPRSKNDNNEISIPWYEPLMFVPCGSKEWLQILDLLRQQGANLNAKNRSGATILYEFISGFCPSFSNSSATQVIERLLEYGVEVSTPASDDYGYTPLHEAVFKRDLITAAYLISKGADIKARSKKGCTPLHIAAAGRPQITKLLIEAGADVNALDENGLSPLVYSLKECIDNNIFMTPSNEREAPYCEAQTELMRAGGV